MKLTAQSGTNGNTLISMLKKYILESIKYAISAKHSTCISAKKYNVFHTSVSAADSLDSSVHQRAASLLNPAGHCYSDPALSGQSLRIVELMINSHNTEQ